MRDAPVILIHHPDQRTTRRNTGSHKRPYISSLYYTSATACAATRAALCDAPLPLRLSSLLRQPPTPHRNHLNEKDEQHEEGSQSESPRDIDVARQVKHGCRLTDYDENARVQERRQDATPRTPKRWRSQDHVEDGCLDADHRARLEDVLPWVRN